MKTDNLLMVILMPEYCIKIIDELIKQRKLKGWTQKDLGQATNLTQSVIARFEKKKAMPQLDTILKIAMALDCRFEIVRNEYKR